MPRFLTQRVTSNPQVKNKLKFLGLTRNADVRIVQAPRLFSAHILLKERGKKIVVQCAHFVERERGGKKNSERTKGPRDQRKGYYWSD